MSVRPKKHLGQHFLTDMSIAERIAQSLTGEGYERVLEIGPGTGVLTQFLLQQDSDLHVIEIDSESVKYLEEHFPQLQQRIIPGDFLRMDWKYLPDPPFAIAGNFPYNISSQILFQVFEHREHIPEVVGMFQKEVAERVASGPGNKTYGILSVLLQTAYEIEYLFTVSEEVFNPPPKVKSGVIRLTRKAEWELPVKPGDLKRVVKAAFNQRRKTLRNALKPLGPTDRFPAEMLQKRAEQLHYEDFITLTKLL